MGRTEPAIVGLSAGHLRSLVTASAPTFGRRLCMADFNSSTAFAVSLGSCEEGELQGTIACSIGHHLIDAYLVQSRSHLTKNLFREFRVINRASQNDGSGDARKRMNRIATSISVLARYSVIQRFRKKRVVRQTSYRRTGTISNRSR